MHERDIEEIVNAKRQIVEGNLILWRTRIVTIAQARGGAAALDLIQAPVEPTEAATNNNFGSGVCCQPPALPSGTVTLGEPTITPID